MMVSWRKNLEQNLMAGAGVFPWGAGAPLLPGHGEHGRPGARTPGAVSPGTRSDTGTPVTDRHTPHHPEESKSPSEDGRLSPGARSDESRSPGKEGVSPTPSPLPASFSSPGLVPRSFANTINTSSSPSQLSIPPLFTSRIPKGDPLEERLHDMLR